MEQEPRTRSAVGSKVAGALLGAIAALSIGGVGFAFAQEAETPTTEAPAAPERPADEDCPDKAGRGPRGGGGGDAGAEAGSTDV